MVLVEVDEDRRSSFQEALTAADIAVGGRGSYRFVTHLDIDDAAITRTVEVIGDWARSI
jgi:threonine aldolase